MKKGRRKKPNKKKRQSQQSFQDPNEPEEDPSTLNMQDSDRLQRRKQILQRCFEKLKVAPDKSLFLCMLVQDSTIRELKKGAVSKFLHWISEFPNNFSVVPVDGGSQYKVTLLSEVMPRLASNKRPRPK